MQLMISICLLALTLSMNLKTLECVQMVTAIQEGKKKEFKYSLEPSFDS